jgi:hypothetical protein
VRIDQAGTRLRPVLAAWCVPDAALICTAHNLAKLATAA